MILDWPNSECWFSQFELIWDFVHGFWLRSGTVPDIPMYQFFIFQFSSIQESIISKADSNQVVCICVCVLGAQRSTPGVFNMQIYLSVPFSLLIKIDP